MHSSVLWSDMIYAMTSSKVASRLKPIKRHSATGAVSCRIVAEAGAHNEGCGGFRWSRSRPSAPDPPSPGSKATQSQAHSDRATPNPTLCFLMLNPRRHPRQLVSCSTCESATQHPAAPASFRLHSKHVPALLIASPSTSTLIPTASASASPPAAFPLYGYHLSTHPPRHDTHDTHKPSIVSFILPSPTPSLSRTYLPTFLPPPILSLLP